jgi:hypothetical protein
VVARQRRIAATIERTEMSKNALVHEIKAHLDVRVKSQTPQATRKSIRPEVRSSRVITAQITN